MIPEWLIDDTTDITDARVYVAHTREPRFFGELVPEDEADPDGITLSAIGEVICQIHWIDQPVFDAEALCRSLQDALNHHWAVREKGG